MKGQDFETIGKVLGVVTATAQVYTIDGYCSGAPLSFPELCDSMNLTPTDIKTLSDGIKRHGTSLRNTRDQLGMVHTYNQIRLVLAAMIRGELH